MFDPRKTVIVEIREIQRRLFWDSVKVYLWALLLLAIPAALAIWAIYEWL